VKSPRLAIGSLVLSAVAFVGIAVSEGYTDTAVIPVPGDVPTMGFGTTEGVKMGDRTTPVKAVQRALQDVSKYEGAVKKCVKVPLHQAEYDVYVDLAYNIGTGAFCGSTLVKLLNQEQYREACEQVLRWDKFKGQPLRGLTLRRQRDHAKCVAAQ
jgi:lysozyme